MPTVYLNVCVDLANVDTCDLTEELSGRDVPTLCDDDKDFLQSLHLALKLGNDETALRLSRELVCKHLGVIL